MKSEFINRTYENQGIINKIVRIYANAPTDAEDLSQEIILQLWRSFPNYRGDCKYSTWMYKVALNTAITFLRKSKRRSEKELPMEGNEAAACVATSGDEDVEILYDGIQKLRKIDRAIIMLYLEDASYEEIASIIGISKSNVSVRLVRIKRKLKKIIENSN
jgi:RNA polymerase sigma-70 factor (ECF subfamily)